MLVRKKNLLKVLGEIAQEKVRSLDTETTGLAERDHLFSIIISTRKNDYYFNFQNYLGADAEAVLDRGDMLLFKPLFSDQEARWYLHNAKFDLGMLDKEGLRIQGTVICTEALGRVVKNNHMRYSLDASLARIGLKKDDAVEKYVSKHRLYDWVTIPGKKKRFKNKYYDQVPLDVIVPYGEMDARGTLALGNHLVSELETNKQLRKVAVNEIRLTQTCFRMERRGILLDRTHTEKALAEEQGKLGAALESFKKFTGEEYKDSSKALAEIFDRMGYRYETTSKGNPSFKDDVLERVNNDLSRAIQKIRFHEKRIGTYYTSFLFFADENDIIRANAKQSGTETGRFSYADPNLQNIPKEEDAAEGDVTVRGCFRPRPEHIFVMIDYDQQEYRMMLDYAGEKQLIDDIMAGADVHQAIADWVGVTRKQAKTLNFAILYGAGPDKIAGMLGINIHEARDLQRLYLARLPRVDDLIARVIGVGKYRGYIRNWFGRHCHIAQRDWAYILPNHLIQGGCADVVKVAMNEIDEFLGGEQPRYKSGILAQVHDELLFEVHKDEMHLIPEFKRIMEAVYVPRNGLKLSASIEWSSKSWGRPDIVEGEPNEQVFREAR